jgi:hypothetical protein
MVEPAATMSATTPRPRSPVKPAVASTTLLLLVSLLPACSTPVGHDLTRDVEEMKMDGAQVTYFPPAHCSGPRYELRFHPGTGIAMTITSDAAGGLGLTWFDMQVETGRSLAFTSTSGRIESLDGTVSDMFVTHVQVMRDPRSVMKPMPADGVMAGSAPAGETSRYSGSFDSSSPGAKAFTLQLPDAVVNGKPYRFPPIRYSARRLTYFQDACLR